jgi:hypothetical protein
MTLPPMSEAELQAQIVELARSLNWLCYHTHDSRRSAKGFPDLVLVHEGSGALVFAELKRDGEHPTLEQRRWLRALARRGAAFVWRPADWRTGDVGRALHRWARSGAPAPWWNAVPGRVDP